VSQPPANIVATISGKDLLDKFDQLTASVNELARKLDDVPAHVADLEDRMRRQEARRCVSWGQLGAVLTLLIAAATLVAAFMGHAG
jgi:hypothetical protein